MKMIETVATVTEDGTLTVQAPLGITAGPHCVVVVIDERVAPAGRQSLQLHAFDLSGAWPPDCSFRREELYGDDGR